MILTCPACLTRYTVEPASLGREGRRVRCAKCGHSWVQGPPQDLPIAVTGEGEPGARAGGVRGWRARREGSGLFGWVFLLLFLGAVAGGGYQFRQVIVEVWPPAAHLYTELGIQLKVLGEGLQIRGIEASQGAQEGMPTLVVVGEVANLTEQLRSIPALRASLLSAEKRELRHWVFRAAKPDLVPGEVTPFRTEVVTEGENATDIAITFTAEEEAQAADSEP